MSAVGSGPVESRPTPESQAGAEHAAGYDPMRLCVLATVAALGWLLGPIALLAFAGLGFAGYWRARRAGLRTSKCLLHDTRLVLGYLGILLAAAGWGIVAWIG